MTAPTERVQLRDATTLLLATLMVSGVAFYNRYPLVYPDTFGYLAGDDLGLRSAFYGFFIAPAMLTHTLWTIVLVQSLLVVGLLRLVLREVFAVESRLEFLALVAVLSAMTSLPWYSGFIMPDIFTPVMVLGLFMLAFCFERLKRWERYFVAILTLAAAMMHYSHIPIAIGLLIAALIARRVGRLRVVEAVPRMALPATLIAVGLVAIVMSNYLTFGIAAYSPAGYAFVIARSVEDGPAVQFLRENCPTRHYAVCNYLDRMPMAGSEFLWGHDSLFRKVGFLGERTEGLEIVTRMVEEYPLWVLRDAIVDALRQLVRVRTGTSLSAAAGNPATVAVVTYYPSEVRAYLSSKQGRGEFIDMPWLSVVHSSVVIVSIFYSVLIGIVFARERQWLAVEFIITVGLAVLLNAFITGAISEPLDRYGSRIIWLVPLIAIASWRKAPRLIVAARPAAQG